LPLPGLIVAPQKTSLLSRERSLLLFEVRKVLYSIKSEIFAFKAKKKSVSGLNE